MKITRLYSFPAFIFLCCLIFFKPILFWWRFPFDILLQISQVSVWILIAAIAFSKIRQWKIYLWLWTGFWVINILIAIYMPLDPMLSTIELNLSLMLLGHFLDQSFASQSDAPIKMIWSYLYVSEIFELITLPFYQQGWISVAWFGIKTRSVDAAIPFILLTFLIRGVLGKRKTIWCTAVAALNIILMGNTAGIAGLMMLAVGVFLGKRGIKISSILTPAAVIASPILLSVILIKYKILNWFRWLFVAVLHKSADMSLTLSGRTEFWPNAIKTLKLRAWPEILFGVGFHNRAEWVQWYRSSTYVEAHDQVLQLLHDVGILGMIVFYMALYLMLRKIKGCDNRSSSDMIMTTAFVCGVICVTEIYGYYPYFYIVFMIAAHSREINKVISNMERERKTAKADRFMV